jgi:hypothetical protein
MAEWYQLNYYQKNYISDALRSEVVQEYIKTNEWYTKFTRDILYDVETLGKISEKQLNQIRKICELSGIKWRLYV